MIRDIKRYARFVFAGLAVMLLCLACANDYTTTESPGTEPAKRKVVFSLQIPGNHTPVTRALDDVDENEVRTVEVLVFAKGGDFLYSAYADDITPAGGNSRSFTVSLSAGDCDIMVLANSREIIGTVFGGEIPRGTPREDIQKGLNAVSAVKWNTDNSDAAYKPIPIWGGRNNVTIDATTSFTGGNSIKLSRMLARIDVAVATAVQGDFKLREIYLYNPYNQGLVIPDPSAAIWNGAADRAVAPSLLPVWNATSGYLLYENGEITEPDKACTGEIYTFEAAKGTGADPGYTGNTFLVVGGEYKGEMSYYRLDFSETTGNVTEYLPLLRNHLYEVNITGIKSKGYSSHQLAAMSLPMNIEAEINVTDENEIGNYVFDGQYYLGTDITEAEFWSWTTTAQVKVKANYPAGWDYTVTDSPNPGGAPSTWLTVTSQTVNGPGQTDELNYSLAENNDPADFRTAYIHLASGRLLQTVKVTQYRYHINSVAVSPKGDIPGAGDNYTVTITGSFQNTPVRAWDMTADALLADNIVLSSTSGGSAMLPVPGFYFDATRTVSFEYYDFAADLWKVIRTSDQYGFEVSTDYDGSPIAAAGQSFNIAVKGTYPELKLRAADRPGNLGISLSGTPTTVYPGTLPTNAIVVLGPNMGNPRTVYLQWSADGVNWHDIVSGQQDNYDFDVKCTSHSSGATINGSGETVTLTVTGSWPNLTFGAFTFAEVSIAPEPDITAGTGTGIVQIKVPNNSYTTGSGSSRSVYIKYTADNWATDKEAVYLNQGIGNYRLQSGRIVAKEYAHETDVYYKTWTEAMGIQALYLTEKYHAAIDDPINYPADRETGCNVYSETDDDKGTWRLPTSGEAVEMIYWIWKVEGGFNTYNYPVNTPYGGSTSALWTVQQESHNVATIALCLLHYTNQPEKNTFGAEGRSKSTKYLSATNQQRPIAARCVRAE